MRRATRYRVPLLRLHCHRFDWDSNGSLLRAEFEALIGYLKNQSILKPQHAALTALEIASQMDATLLPVDDCDPNGVIFEEFKVLCDALQATDVSHTNRIDLVARERIYASTSV